MRLPPSEMCMIQQMRTGGKGRKRRRKGWGQTAALSRRCRILVECRLTRKRAEFPKKKIPLSLSLFSVRGKKKSDTSAAPLFAPSPLLQLRCYVLGRRLIKKLRRRRASKKKNRCLLPALAVYIVVESLTHK